MTRVDDTSNTLMKNMYHRRQENHKITRIEYNNHWYEKEKIIQIMKLKNIEDCKTKTNIDIGLDNKKLSLPTREFTE